jgi:hypothetical protein
MYTSTAEVVAVAPIAAAVAPALSSAPTAPTATAPTATAPTAVEATESVDMSTESGSGAESELREETAPTATAATSATSATAISATAVTAVAATESVDMSTATSATASATAKKVTESGSGAQSELRGRQAGRTGDVQVSVLCKKKSRTEQDGTYTVMTAHFEIEEGEQQHHHLDKTGYGMVESKRLFYGGWHCFSNVLLNHFPAEIRNWLVIDLRFVLMLRFNLIAKDSIVLCCVTVILCSCSGQNIATSIANVKRAGLCAGTKVTLISVAGLDDKEGYSIYPVINLCLLAFFYLIFLWS